MISLLKLILEIKQLPNRMESMQDLIEAMQKDDNIRMQFIDAVISDIKTRDPEFEEEIEAWKTGMIKRDGTYMGSKVWKLSDNNRGMCFKISLIKDLIHSGDPFIPSDEGSIQFVKLTVYYSYTLF